MKYILTVLTLICITALVATPTVVDRVVAKVGRDVILQSDLDTQMKQLSMDKDTAGFTSTEVLEQMIESRLILQKAKDKNYAAEDLKVQGVVEKRTKEIMGHYKSEEEFRSELRSKTGMSFADYRRFMTDMVTEQMLRQQIIDAEIQNRAQATQQEVEEFYEKHRDELPKRPAMDKLGMIVRTIKASDQTKASARKAIEGTLLQLKAGADFATLAQQSSDCPSSAQGGDLGFFGRGSMVKTFEDPAFALSVGQYSGIVETEFGYHIIKLEEKDGNDIRVRHILKKVEPSDADVKSTHELMEQALAELRNGGDFTAVADKYGERDSLTAESGIIGEFRPDDYPPLFADQIKNIGYGQYTDVIQEGDILYIFGKLSASSERDYQFGEVESQLREQLLQEKQALLYRQWMDRIKKEKLVEILVPQE
jgi:peptidyl-prolyl cis-trans isomerase SurA